MILGLLTSQKYRRLDPEDKELYDLWVLYMTEAQFKHLLAIAEGEELG